MLRRVHGAAAHVPKNIRFTDWGEMHRAGDRSVIRCFHQAKKCLSFPAPRMRPRARGVGKCPLDVACASLQVHRTSTPLVFTEAGGRRGGNGREEERAFENSLLSKQKRSKIQVSGFRKKKGPSFSQSFNLSEGSIEGGSIDLDHFFSSNNKWSPGVVDAPAFQHNAGAEKRNSAERNRKEREEGEREFFPVIIIADAPTLSLSPHTKNLPLSLYLSLIHIKPTLPAPRADPERRLFSRDH